MFVIRKTNTNLFNQTNSNLKKCRLSLKVDSSQKQQPRTLKTLIEEYENKLLYNSIIASTRVPYEQLQKHKKYQELLTTALRTTQPLPISLKYVMDTKPNENSDDNCEKTDIQDDLTNTKNTHFPFESNIKVDDIDFSEKNNTIFNKDQYPSLKEEVLARRKLLTKEMSKWMTHYDNYQYDLVQASHTNVHCDINIEDDWTINYGTPDPTSQISNHPCGGCGAHLHCRDTAIPGYIPSEIFKNCFDPNGANFGAVLCQRCHFLKQYDIALQVRVSPDDYPKVLKTISQKSSLVILMVDLTDFPCSIWPGVADILGPKTPIVVVGNKVDLIPKDCPAFLKKIREVLHDNVKMCGFASANIKHIELISARTGYGIENLITVMSKIWRYKGDVYLVGCTNVGKSSLFNALLQSDFCKIQAADLIQRATTSHWPGTTLNLLKFPITRLSGYKEVLRTKRLIKLKLLEAKERKRRSDNLNKVNTAKYATLIGHIGRSLDMPRADEEENFSVSGSSKLSGQTKLGIDETHPNFVLNKWCYDTPGVVHPDQILHILTTDELLKTLPKQLIRPETFCVKPGTTVFIAGLARLDYIEGPKSIRLTVFRSNELPLTVCQTPEADSVYKDLLGTELFMVPFDDGDRLTKWPGLELAKTFKVSGKSWVESSYDVVLSSAGWIAINCGLDQEFEFQAWTPDRRGVYVRDCILPRAVTLRGPRILKTVAYKKHKFI